MTLTPARFAEVTPGLGELEDLRETLRKLSDGLGSMTGAYDMAHAPLVLGVHDRFQQAIIDHGTFDARTREAIALVVAAVDRCTDCQFPHIAGCRAAGWTRDQTVALCTGARIAGEEKTTALLAVARQVAGQGGDVDGDTWQRALRTGWTTEELAELFTHVMANVCTNYLYHFTQGEGDRDTSGTLDTHEVPA